MTTTWSWRIPSILQGIPSLLQLFLIWLIPESPRWLVSRGRDEQAIKVITRYHCNGESEDPLVAFEYEEIKEALRIEREAEKGSSWKALFTKRGNLRRLRVIVALGFFSQWSGNGLVSYYLTLVLDGIGIKATGTQTLINGILQIYNYGTAIIGALTVERAGRRILFLTSTGGMCLAFTLWTICSALYTKSAAAVDAAGNPIHPDKAAGHGVLAFIFIYYGFYNVSRSPRALYNLY